MMKKLFFVVCLALAAFSAMAQQFDEWFVDRTLRLDYILAGNNRDQQIFMEQMASTPRWAGRKSRLTEVPLKGNGQLTVKDHATGTTLFVHTFSTLFQE